MESLYLSVHSKNIICSERTEGILEDSGNYPENMAGITTKNVTEEKKDEVSTNTVIDTVGEEEKRYEKTFPKKIVAFSEFELDVNLRTLQWKSQNLVPLSGKETKILLELIENKGNIVKRDFLLHRYWGEVSYYKSRCLDVLISKLRKRLRLDPSISIVNYRREGLRIIF